MSCSSLPPPRRQCYEQTIIQVRLNGIRIGKIPGYSFLAIVLIGVYEAAYGMLAVRSSLGACGHFDNPAGFAAFLAALFPFTLYFIGLRQKLSVVFGMTAAAVLLFAIALSGSRAGWIAVLVVGIYYLWPRLFSIWRYRSRCYKICILCCLGGFGTAGCIGLYHFKKDSADGRILIWRNTVTMIVDKPLFGHGTDGFRAQYMLYQADYFRKHPDSKYAMLADNVQAPFNEYLRFAAEYGIIGLLAVGSILWIILHCRQRRIPHFKVPFASLLGVGIMALFSYPFHYPALLVVSGIDFFMLAGICFDWRAWGKRVVGLSFLIMAGHSILSRIDQHHWQQAVGPRIDHTSVIREYEKLASTKFNDNPAFLYAYGLIQNREKRYIRSLEILDRYFRLRADVDAAIVQIDNHYRLGHYAKAWEWAVLASDMCPNRFIPLYYKVLILDATGHLAEAKELARQVLSKPIKVRATDVYKVRVKLQHFLSVHS